MSKQYKIIEIALDEDGMFWLYYYGDVAEQGGCRFGKGSMGFTNLDDSLRPRSSIYGMPDQGRKFFPAASLGGPSKKSYWRWVSRSIRVNPAAR